MRCCAAPPRDDQRRVPAPATSPATAPKGTQTNGAEVISNTNADLTAVKMIQRNYRGYRDMRETELGFSLRKTNSTTEGSCRLLDNVLKLIGTGVERPSGHLTTREKQALLRKARKEGTGVHLRGKFGQSVLARVANLGKGISEAENPMLLAQHQWLEATDQRHRYGASLFEYYALWAVSETTDGFFYWLDYGEGKDVSADKCPRDDLEAGEVQYCNKVERLQFVVHVVNGKLHWANQGMKLITSAKKPKPPKDDPDGTRATGQCWRLLD